MVKIRRLAKRQTQRLIVPQSKSRWAPTLCVCQTMMDSNTSTVFSHPNTQRKTWEHWDSKRNVCSELGLIKQYLDIELELRHAPLIISESGCNTNTEAVSTPREKLQDKLLLDGRRSPILTRDDATRYRSACMRLSYVVQDRLDLAETAKHLAQRMSEPRDFDFGPLKRAARFRRQKHVDKITVFVDSDFPGDPVSRKSTTGLEA